MKENKCIYGLWVSVVPEWPKLANLPLLIPPQKAPAGQNWGFYFTPHPKPLKRDFFWGKCKKQ